MAELLLRLAAFRRRHPEIEPPCCVGGIWRADLPLRDDRYEDGVDHVTADNLGMLMDKIEMRYPPDP